MIRFLADESFEGDIVRALRRRLRTINLLTAHEAGLRGAPDPTILEWAAMNDRIVLASDKETMIGFAYDRVLARLPMPGLMHSEQDAKMGPVIDDLLLIAQCLSASDWENTVTHLPF